MALEVDGHGQRRDVAGRGFDMHGQRGHAALFAHGTDAQIVDCFSAFRAPWPRIRPAGWRGPVGAQWLVWPGLAPCRRRRPRPRQSSTAGKTRRPPFGRLLKRPPPHPRARRLGAASSAPTYFRHPRLLAKTSAAACRPPPGARAPRAAHCRARPGGQKAGQHRPNRAAAS